MSDPLWPHGLQHTRPSCPSPTPGVYPNSAPLSPWCHPAISSSVVPFSSRLQFFPASASFQMSQLFASGGQSIGVSASTSVLPVNTQDWSPLGWTGWTSWQCKGLSRVFSNITVQKHQFFSAQYYWSLGVRKWKQQRDAITRRLEWQNKKKKKTDTTKCWQECRVREHSLSTDGNRKQYSYSERQLETQNGTATVKDILVVSHKTKQSYHLT